MKVVRDLHWLPTFHDGSVVTVGEFDGVHRGHRVVLSELSQRGALAGCPTVVVTFDRNPTLATNRTSGSRQLCSIDQKLELLASAGVDLTLVLPAEYVALVPDEETGEIDDNAILQRLIDEVLIGALNPVSIVVGEDFNFGERRRSTIDLLTDQSDSRGFEVAQVPVASCTTGDGAIISATSIRRALDSGDLHLAQQMLGRPYEIRSTVAVGERRGRLLGFPTANLPVPDNTQLPADGVYAGWYARSDGNRFPAAVNVGRRPTFYESNDTSLIEAHLVGFKGDLYNEPARLTFMHHLRPERKFDGVDELSAQLKSDVSMALDRLQE